MCSIWFVKIYDLEIIPQKNGSENVKMTHFEGAKPKYCLLSYQMLWTKFQK